MTSYYTIVAACSPLLSYSPGWFNGPYTPAFTYYTDAPKASVSIDFYGTQFELRGLQPQNASSACGFNTTINGQLQNPSNMYYNNLPLDQYHVEMDVFCTAQGSEFGFTGVDFVPTQGTTILNDNTAFLDSKEIHTVGQWQEQSVFSSYYDMNFTALYSQTYGSTLEYSFKGVKTEIRGTVLPDGSDFIATIDGIPSKVLSTKNSVTEDSVLLWFAEFLDNNSTHVVTVTNLGTNLQVLNANYDYFTGYPGQPYVPN